MCECESVCVMIMIILLLYQAIVNVIYIRLGYSTESSPSKLIIILITLELRIFVGTDFGNSVFIRYSF